MTANGCAKDFGRYLQSCRRARGISLGVVSHQTKITLENLRRIEKERLDQLPSSVFVKGFIKSFAHTVGADPAEAILRFESHVAANYQAPDVSVQTPDASFAWYHLAAAVVLFSVLIGATLYLADWLYQPLPATLQAVAAPSEKTQIANALEHSLPLQVATQSTPIAKVQPLENNAPDIEKSLSPENKPSEIKNMLPQPANMAMHGTPPGDALNLRISAVEATWLKVVIDENLTREFLLQPDQDVTLTAERRFNLTIGNAGGIRLKLNDQEVRVVGSSGRVVNLQLP